MGAASVLAPVFVQVALTLGLLFWMGKLRVGAVKSGAVRIGDIALGQQNWPQQATQVGNSYRSQFELPALFYLVSMLSLFTARASVLLVVLAWLFVVSRLLHALIHVTTNNVARRFFLFLAGAVILTLMWIVYGVDLYFGGSGPLPPLDVDALGGDVPPIGQ
jgi:hypothetical protein